MKKGKDKTTKSITKWSVSREDWNDGADLFEKAAKLYTHEGNVEMARTAWRKASEAHDKANNTFFAGKALETLARFLLDQESPANKEKYQEEAAQCYLDAGTLFMLNNQPEKQAEAMVKAAKLAPKDQAAKSSKMILDAIEKMEDADKHHYTLDMYRALILMQVRGELWPGVIDTLKRQNKAFQHLSQPASAAKTPLEIVVVALYLGDFVLAEREFQQATQTAFGFPHSKEQAVAYELIAAVEERDEERLADARKDQTLTFLTSDISRMAKKIRLEGMKGVAAKASAASSGAKQAVVSSPIAPEDDSDSEDAK